MKMINAKPDNAPDTLATPEGDNETTPDQPLSPNPRTPERPRGNEPHPAQPIRDALAPGH